MAQKGRQLIKVAPSKLRVIKGANETECGKLPLAGSCILGIQGNSCQTKDFQLRDEMDKDIFIGFPLCLPSPVVTESTDTSKHSLLHPAAQALPRSPGRAPVCSAFPHHRLRFLLSVALMPALVPLSDLCPLFSLEGQLIPSLLVNQPAVQLDPGVLAVGVKWVAYRSDLNLLKPSALAAEGKGGGPLP